MTTSDPLSRRAFLAGTLGAGAAGLVACHVAAPIASSAEEPRMNPAWKIGCYTRPWAQQDYRVALDAIAEAGFKYAGLMTAKAKGGLVISAATPLEEAQQVGEEAKKRRLGILSVYGGDIPVAKSLEAGIEGLRKLIDNCTAVGAGNLLMGGAGDEKLQETYYKAIAECCDYAASKKLGISVKPHGGLNSTGPQCRRIVERVGHKNFGLWYDPGNIFYYSDGRLDPVADAATVDGLVVGMSVKDYLPPKNVDVTPGTGTVDFRAVMARLKKGGFAGGPLVVETLAPGDLAKTLDEARKALKFVQEVVAAIG
jgi:sugar phosphate isomerase/epimerase